MIRNIIAGVAIIALCSGMAAAQQQAQKDEGLASWLKSMQKKLDIINPRKAPPVTTGVAGVRGAKQDDKAKLYWKGRKGDEQVSDAELREFKEAVEYAEKGNNPAAVRELEEFMKQFPDSALIPDAKKMLDLVQNERKPEPKAGAKAAPAPEVKTDAPAPRGAGTKPEAK